MKRFWLCCLVLTTACGGGGSSTPTTPGSTSIAITGSDLMLVGNSETFTAAGNGTGALGASRWSTDTPSVATVDAGTGRVAAVGIGSATISAEASGIRGTKLIRTVPNFAGSWSGSYQIARCESSGDFATVQFCSNWSAGDLLNMTMTLTQSRDAVSGGFGLGSLRATDVSGSVSSLGMLSFTGTVRDVVNIQLQNVRFESTQSGQITGTFEQVWGSGTTAASGTGRLFAELRDMTHSSGLTPLTTGPDDPPRTLEEMVRAARRR